MTTNRPRGARIPESDGGPPDEAIATTPLPDVTEHEAYLQGWWAYSFGRHNWDNPYNGDDGPEADKASDQWELGWLAAQAEDEG